MKIAILGPLAITDDFDVPLDIKLEPKQAIVLVTLAANADRGAPLRELVSAIHGTNEADLYKRSVESLVSRLRSSLRHIDADAAALVPSAKGGFYTLRIPLGQIDAMRFLHRAEHLLNNWSTLSSHERVTEATRAIGEWRADPARVYGGASPAAAEIFRRFTATLTELGGRYCRLLLHEQRFDQAQRELSRLIELLPGQSPFAQLQREAVHRDIRVTRPAADLDGPVRPDSAMAELRDRLAGSRALGLDAIAVTAHNLDRIYLVDRVAPDHEVKIDVAAEAPGGSGANTIAALGRLGCSVAAAGIVADDSDGHALLDDLSSRASTAGTSSWFPGARRFAPGTASSSATVMAFARSTCIPGSTRPSPQRWRMDPMRLLGWKEISPTAGSSISRRSRRPPSSGSRNT